MGASRWMLVSASLGDDAADGESVAAVGRGVHHGGPGGAATETEMGPSPISRIDHVWVPMRDGVRLAARLWLPEMPAGERVPVIVDCHPYRLSDSASIRDGRVYAWFASHGYACCRVDLRGSGNSEGVLEDEYLPLEQQDGLDVLAWLAEQEWSNGTAGYIGISWGGFGGLQLAAHRPPSLKALITICSTDDRYEDDVHYRGGALLAHDMLPWASTMLMLNSLPPDPVVAGEPWRTMWTERLERTPPFIDAWMHHPLRDDYWRQGSVCEDYAAIEAPTLIVGGWADGYVDAVPRLLKGLTCARRAIIGPWSHGSPEEGVPGPAIGFLQECLRWWDHWLKGADSGVMEDAPLRAWLQESVTPVAMASGTDRPGRWIEADSFETGVTRSFYLSGDGLLPSDTADERVLTVSSPQSLGVTGGAWCPVGLPGDWPGDQREDDAHSLCFTSEPLAEPLTLLGNPEVRLRVASSERFGFVCVRLCEVAQDGASLLISRGLLDLRHRDGHDRLVNLVPGDLVEVKVALKVVGHLVPVGHSLRVAISSTCWPWAWPQQGPFTLSVVAGGASVLRLPVAYGGAHEPAAFGAPAQAPAPAFEVRRGGSLGRVVERDLVQGIVRLVVTREAPLVWLTGADLEMQSSSRTVYTIVDSDPASARVECESRALRRREGWEVAIETASTMAATPDGFVVTVEAAARLNGESIHTRREEFTYPRS